VRLPRSLQARLALALGLALALLWTAAAAVAAQRLRAELDGVFDSALEETGQRLLPLAVLEILNREEGDTITQRVAPLRLQGPELSYLVRDAEGTVLIRSHAADPAIFPPFTGTGFARTPTHRIYQDAALQGTVTIAVAEALAHRRKIVREAIWALALPLGLLLPASLAGVWALVRASMRPIRSFRDAIAARGGGDLAPVPAAGLPIEIAPVAAAVNGLMDRVQRTLEAERSFTANAAHELRTPVAAALAQTQRLVAELGDSAARRRAQDIEKALKRLARLAEKLLQLARAEGGRLRASHRSDLIPVLRMVIDEWPEGATRRDRIELSLPDGPVLSDIDPEAFAILARNLVDNALRHGPVDEPVSVALASDGGLRVVNGGPALPPEAMDRLARPFERGQTRAAGSGLGLAIAGAIARNAGAELTLRSPAEGRIGGFEALLTPAAATPAQKRETASQHAARRQ
jgi:two-component system OmpR family sensor kinase